MRYRFLDIALALLVGSEVSALAQCNDKSQQNAADEAGIKGNLGAASKCATQADKAQSEKKLEDAAAKAKDSVHGRGDAATQSLNRRFTACGIEGVRQAIVRHEPQIPERNADS
jgi:hypothetical protein